MLSKESAWPRGETKKAWRHDRKPPEHASAHFSPLIYNLHHAFLSFFIYLSLWDCNSCSLLILMKFKTVSMKWNFPWKDHQVSRSISLMCLLRDFNFQNSVQNFLIEQIKETATKSGMILSWKWRECPRGKCHFLQLFRRASVVKLFATPFSLFASSYFQSIIWRGFVKKYRILIDCWLYWHEIIRTALSKE